MKVNKCLQISARISAFSAVALVFCLALSRQTPRLADFFNNNPCRALRGLLSRMCGTVPVFLPELFIALLPVTVLLIFVASLKLSWRTLLSGLVLASSLITSIYTLTLGFAYRATPVSELMGIFRQGECSVGDVESALTYLTERILETAADAGEYDFTLANLEIRNSYSDFYESYPILDEYTPNPKEIFSSRVASRIGILGLYFPLTAEAGINVAQPKYAIPFSIAHELAHAKGVAREDEANFLAFVICSEARDSFVRYSGYLCAFEIVGSALYKQDPSAYFDIARALPQRAISDLRAASQLQQSADNSVSDALASLNDAHLESATGTGSECYTQSLDLIVSYLLR